MVETFTVHITPYDLDRNTFIYLPDNWQTSGRRYPVIYMFDGHNLFFDSTATFGTCWGLKDYLDAHPNAIVVAPECNHEGNKRLEEYCPYDSDWFDGIHGTGKQYMDWLVNELKPAIDAKYPTLPDRGNTAIGGSSMGGLMSLYAITAYNKVFSKAACLSPSVRICLPQVKAELKKAKLAPDTRVYLSWGEKDGKGKHQLAQYTANALAVTRGLSGKGAEVYPYLQMNGKHCEADWRKQLGRCFKFCSDGRRGKVLLFLTRRQTKAANTKKEEPKMSKAVIFFAQGLEECEALLCVDILRRAGVEVTIAAVGGERIVTSARQVNVVADALAEELDYAQFDACILPGGIPGVPNLKADATVRQVCTDFAAAGKKVCAICAAPTALAAFGVLQGKKATVYPGMDADLTVAGAAYTGLPLTIDGNIITGEALGAAIPFALAIARELAGADAAARVKKAIVYQ